MRDLNSTRDKIYHNWSDLKSLKFSPDISQETSLRLSEEEKKLYDKYKFYKEYIRIGGKLNGRQIRIKEK